MNRRSFLAMLAAVPVTAGAGNASAHDFTFANIDGGEIRLSDFAGRPVMVVNTASRCGFTYQYDGLQALYDSYRDRGLVVLTVPSDDFGGQELASEEEVKEFCAVNFNLDMPMTTITRVKGTDAHPFFLWARQAFGQVNAPRWNFHKYLLGPDGQPVAAFGSRVEPTGAMVTRAVEDLLG